MGLDMASVTYDHVTKRYQADTAAVSAWYRFVTCS